MKNKKQDFEMTKEEMESTWNEFPLLKKISFLIIVFGIFLMKVIAFLSMIVFIVLMLKYITSFIK